MWASYTYHVFKIRTALGYHKQLLFISNINTVSLNYKIMIIRTLYICGLKYAVPGFRY